MNEKAFLIIPYSIVTINELSLSQKLVLCEIISLSKSKGYCYASNRYISSRTSIKPNTVSVSISALKSKGYLTIKYIDKRRRIYINRDKFKAKTLSIIDYALSKTKMLLSDSDTSLSKYHTNKKSYNTINKKSNKKERRSYAGYDIDELMKIK